MNKKVNIIRTGLVALASLFLICMIFTPVVAADNYYVGSAHYDGVEKYDGLSQVVFNYNSFTNTVIVEPKSGVSDAHFQSGEKVNLTIFGLLDNEAKIIDVSPSVNLSDASGVFSAFADTKPTFLYLGEYVAQDVFSSSAKVFKVIANESHVYVNNISGSGTYTSGKAFPIDSLWGFGGSVVKIVVSPASGYGVYDWYINKGTELDLQNQLDSDMYIEKSKSAEDGATTYNLTLPTDLTTSIYVEPKLRDSGSTIVSYVFLDADTYIMEIPADFAMKKIGTAGAVDNKTINITSCDLLTDHSLNVVMNSTNGYSSANGGFQMANVRVPTAFAIYEIGMKKSYTTIPETSYTTISENDKIILDTVGMDQEKIASHIVNGTLKTDLKFTLNKIMDTSILGKYKDKLTFIVGIADAS